MSQIKLKICGVQTPDEARQLSDLGVDYIGLNFVPTSSRVISIDTAESITRAIQASPVQTVALFRNHPIKMINEYAQRLGIDYVQLHGTESADYARQIDAPVIRAVSSDPNIAADLLNFISNFPATHFVLDRIQQGQGPPVDVALAKQIITAAPGKIFLAGSLNLDNLGALLKTVQPYGIDIASGVRTNDHLDFQKVTKCLEIISAA